ncbi:hypothetical protein [Lactiplantibacillus herbarum]|uniref:hypothetical protein n=1 Tax=Lactiplantibacillus herbarum TaxID=1670446 RepID=UPI000B0D1424|nr:hypothetical protein [Lactiplantibacillus herbarum]
MLDQYKIGELVYATYGTLPLVGTIVQIDSKHQKYLVRFSGVQQLYYTEDELKPYRH